MFQSSDYNQTPFGGWIRKADGSGPYSVDAGLGQSKGLVQLPSGFWVGRDGSGPYFRDVDTGTAIEVTSVFRSTT